MAVEVVVGSASAETSATVRFAQESVTGCQPGLGSTVEQPAPEPDHTLSLQPLTLPALVRLVPPTAVTNGEDAGYSAP